jgi:hypothetical protein
MGTRAFGWAIEKVLRGEGAGLEQQARRELRAFRAVMATAKEAELRRVVHVIAGEPRNQGRRTKGNTHRTWMQAVKAMHGALVWADELRRGRR